VPIKLADDPLVMTWQWLPVPPWPLTRPLPARSHRDDLAFLAGTLADEAAMAAFRFSFPQLARQTPDLRFYRLIQLFNTPLRSLTTRDAGRSGYAYWQGRIPSFRDEFRWAHFWFFEDANDRDTVVVEYGFEGGLTLWSEGKNDADLAARYARIVALATRSPGQIDTVSAGGGEIPS